jgi:hypothetical protein
MMGENRSEERRSKTRSMVRKCVNDFNALSLPFSWLGVDTDGRLHLTRIARLERLPWLIMPSPAGLERNVDFIWELMPDGRYSIVKDRTGEFAAYHDKKTEIKQVIRFAI